MCNIGLTYRSHWARDEYCTAYSELSYSCRGSSSPACLFFFRSPFSNQRPVNWPCIFFILSRTNPPVLREPSWPHVTQATKRLVSGTLLLKWRQGLIFFLAWCLFYLRTSVCTQLHSHHSNNVFQGLDRLQWRRYKDDFSPSSGKLWRGIEKGAARVFILK